MWGDASRGSEPSRREDNDLAFVRGSRLYLVEFGDGTSVEIPEVWIEAVLAQRYYRECNSLDKFEFTSAGVRVAKRCRWMMGQGFVRIVVELDPRALRGNATERLWAEPIGEGRFRLRNSPFFAFGVSNEDVVFGDVREREVYLAGVSIRGGHSTYRLRLPGQDRQATVFRNAWAPLAALGCSYEEGPVLAVDVPASADIYAVYELLAAGSSVGAWDFEEGHCGHPVRPGGDR